MSDNIQITEYTETAAALADLRQRYESAVFDCSTTEGDRAARAARRELVVLRGKLETMREAIKAPALERCRLIDAEAKRIKAQILELEQPIDSQIMAEEARKEAIKAAERARVEAMQKGVRELQQIALSGIGKSSEEISALMQRIEGAHYQTDVENAAATDALESLAKEHGRAVLREEAEAKREAELAERERLLAIERAELERLQKEQARAQAEALAAQQKALDEQRQAQEAAARIEREKIASEKAKADAERAEADRLAKIERDRLAAIAADEAAKQQAIIDKQLADIAEANRLAKIEADAKAEAERIAKEQAEAIERQREIESATLVSAAFEALQFLQARHPGELVTLKLAAAVERMKAQNLEVVS